MNPELEKILEARVQAELPALIELRRDLHAHPQLAYEETHASEAIRRELENIPVPFEAGLAETGLVGWILPSDPEKQNAPAIALRADMDALPIQEETGLPYASHCPGRMHACGHDGHTAVLVGAARVLSGLKDHLPRPVKLIFQPAEEGLAGAAKMMEQGALDARVGGLEVAAIFGLHGDPREEVGSVATRTGFLLAACDELVIQVHGRGGHAAWPQGTADPVAASAQMITALQTVVARNVDPLQAAVVTISAIHGGEAYNVIPDQVKLRGTVRTFEPKIRERVHERIEQIAMGVSTALGCSASVQFLNPYPALSNDPEATAFAVRAAEEALGADKVNPTTEPKMGGEDFAFYTAEVPGCFSFIGVRPSGQPEYPPLHTSRYDFNDAAIPTGVRLFCQWALHAGELP